MMQDMIVKAGAVITRSLGVGDQELPEPANRRRILANRRRQFRQANIQTDRELPHLGLAATTAGGLVVRQPQVFRCVEEVRAILYGAREVAV